MGLVAVRGCRCPRCFRRSPPACSAAVAARAPAYLGRLAVTRRHTNHGCSVNLDHRKASCRLCRLLLSRLLLPRPRRAAYLVLVRDTLRLFARLGQRSGSAFWRTREVSALFYAPARPLPPAAARPARPA